MTNKLRDEAERIAKKLVEDYIDLGRLNDLIDPFELEKDITQALLAFKGEDDVQTTAFWMNKCHRAEAKIAELEGKLKEYEIQVWAHYEKLKKVLNET
jgi:hypothetical protein